MQRILTALTLGLAALQVHAEVINIDNAELLRLQAAGVPVVDVRTAPEWQETGIVPGSHLLTFFGTGGRAEPAAWLRKLQPIATPDQPVILICRSGNRTRTISNFLSSQVGYTKVYNVTRGIKDWIKDGKPLNKAEQAASTCNWASTC
ncbi:rhodanese-like domain-containing protein [Nitrogeniibacter aestuarii]|uniref:rhodanese-like domain-containing protein n=1 Tax=Nitrogeniibacter aestuarii TaxID=2815343 RepID=UPI001E3B2104|nr:rhodanese-like domain-containing protein [Nitrogeniibacter aestuarii]